MNRVEFVKAVKLTVYDAVIEDSLSLLAKPPGRRPPKELCDLSAWFNSLTDEDKRMVRLVIELATQQSVFGFFAVLDGIRVVEDGPDRGSIQLSHVHGSTAVALNGDSGPYLHDLFNQEIGLVDKP